MGSDNRAALEEFTKALTSGDIAAMGGLVEAFAIDDVVEEWPQSGERIRGRDAIRRLAESYEGATGTRPKFSFRRIVGDGDVHVVEGTIDYGDGTPVSYVGIAEFRDGRLIRVTEYFANPFEAPAWRKDLVERMEPAAV